MSKTNKVRPFDIDLLLAINNAFIAGDMSWDSKKGLTLHTSPAVTENATKPPVEKTKEVKEKTKEVKEKTKEVKEKAVTEMIKVMLDHDKLAKLDAKMDKLTSKNDTEFEIIAENVEAGWVEYEIDTADSKKFSKFLKKLSISEYMAPKVEEIANDDDADDADDEAENPYVGKSLKKLKKLCFKRGIRTEKQLNRITRTETLIKALLEDDSVEELVFEEDDAMKALKSAKPLNKRKDDRNLAKIAKLIEAEKWEEVQEALLDAGKLSKWSKKGLKKFNKAMGL